MRCTKREVVCVYAQDLEFGESRFNARRREAATAKARLEEVEDAFRFLKSLPKHEAARRIMHVVQSDDSSLDVLISLARDGSGNV